MGPGPGRLPPPGLRHHLLDPAERSSIRRRGRRENDSWRDYNHLRDAGLRPDEPVHFFGGRDYLPLYYRLADDLPGRKVIHHKADPPRWAGYDYEAYMGPANTNWHYSAAEAFIRSRTGTAA